MSDLRDLYPPMLNVGHISEILDVSHNTVRRLIDNGDIPSIRVGPKLIKVPRDEFLALYGLTAIPVGGEVA